MCTQSPAAEFGGKCFWKALKNTANRLTGTEKSLKHIQRDRTPKQIEIGISMTNINILRGYECMGMIKGEFKE